jgi:hypothetical protein
LIRSSSPFRNASFFNQAKWMGELIPVNLIVGFL